MDFRNRIFKPDYILLVFILMIGGILRFYHYSEIPFTYDEFSAFFRTGFDNFRDLIEYGVKRTDTHPAGVQVFIYYWIKWIGSSEPVVKLPFTLMGIVSIFLSYIIASRWFNRTVGLITATYIAVIQYTVMYSVIARPYISGMFLALLMVWFWTNVVFNRSKNYYWFLTGFIITGAMNAYNHHFSLLLVAMVGFTGLFFIPKKHLRSYILAGIIIFILYIPHLPIFFTQLGYKGIESWLGKPDSMFLFNYLGFILHFSIIFYITTVALIILSFFYRADNIKETNKFRIIGLSWFSITFLIGFFYSVFISAIIQYSVLIFTFPFLLMALFSYFKELKIAPKILIVLLIASVSIYTLIFNRHYYKYFYASGFKEIIKESVKTQNKFGKENVTVILNTIDKINDYYLDKLNISDNNFIYLDSLGSYKQFRDSLKKIRTEYVIFAWANYTDLQFLQISEDIFPNIIEKKTWFTSSFYLLKKTKPKDMEYTSADKIIFESINNYETTVISNWDTVPENLILPKNNPATNHYMQLSKWRNYSPGITLELDSIINNKNNLILISLDAYFLKEPSEVLLISELRSGDEVIDWRSIPFTDFISRVNEQQTVYLPLKLSDINLNQKGITLSVVIWNKSKTKVLIDNFRIITYEGNTVIYGQFEKF
jgi:hypothetical protein